MACPFFYPIENRTDDFDPRSAMLPLGRRWDGECRATAPGRRPDPDTVNGVCCLGYARGRCVNFPENPESADAVRFHITRDGGTTIELYCVLERDHHPFAHGPLEYSPALRRFGEMPFGPIVARQAEAYLESYRSRK